MFKQFLSSRKTALTWVKAGGLVVLSYAARGATGINTEYNDAKDFITGDVIDTTIANNNEADRGYSDTTKFLIGGVIAILWGLGTSIAMVVRNKHCPNFCKDAKGNDALAEIIESGEGFTKKIVKQGLGDDVANAVGDKDIIKEIAEALKDGNITIADVTKGGSIDVAKKIIGIDDELDGFVAIEEQFRLIREDINELQEIKVLGGDASHEMDTTF